MPVQKIFNVRTGKREECLVNEVYGGGSAFDIEKDRANCREVERRRQLLAQRTTRRDVGRPEAYRLVAAIHAALRVVRSPARGILKQSNRANSFFLAKIEPMPSSAWHAQ